MGTRRRWNAGGDIGSGSGYVVDEKCRSFVLLGDESAMPAIAQLLEVIGPEAEIIVHVEN